MTWLIVLALLTSTPDRAMTAAAGVVEISISPKVNEARQWCAEPVFDVKLTNSGPKTIWLELGTSSNELDVASHLLSYDPVRGMGTDEGSENGHTDDWGSIEVLRSPEATMLRSGESATRIARLAGVRPRAGRVTVEITVRIRGTQDLEDSKVHTYKSTGVVRARIRQHGRCFEARRLTQR